jgi:hypothetical protein
LPSARSRNSAVDTALDILRDARANGREVSISAAARRAGAARTTVRDRWHQAGGELRTNSGREPSAAPPEHEIEPNEVPVFFRDYSHLDRLHVFPLGDIHKGSPHFQAAKWSEWLAYITQTESASMLGTGDFLNVAIKSSVSDVYEEEQTVGEAKRELAEELQPLQDAGRLDLLIPGNHENRITRETGDCPIQDVAWKLDANYARTAAVVVYKVGEIEYELYLRHGSGSGRAGAQANRLERQALIVVADIYVNGHTHRQQLIRGAIFERHGDKIKRRRQLYISSGSLLSYEGYAAAFGLPPADVGAPRIRLDGTRKDAHASI